ncbi:thiamine pyrophosphate-dependent enzyme [Bacillus piscicola]|uniref:thiamine pyrophosphate-dependent enzyme n=1 Tax=Bacillus piscicola TaxID=1632684 RepID=UPI001F0933C5|nr:thiamine pyrophosphate-dependent enzyme [Bacillus piscicola]
MAELRGMTSAQAIVASLKQEGVRHVFGVPGESYLPLLDAIYEEQSITFVSNRHEGGAAFMAEGYAKAANRTAVVMATRGVGAANASIGVHTAYQDSTPMVVFLGQVHSKFRGREGFQEIELDRFFGEITKWGVEIRDPARTPELVLRAFRIATSGRPGPVVVSLPEDVLPKKADMIFSAAVQRPTPAVSNQDIGKAINLLAKAQRPVLIAGGGVKAANAEKELQSFVEEARIPVVASFRRQDVLANDHPHYVGHLGLGTPSVQLETVRKADVILAVGTRLSEVTTQDYRLLRPEQILIHLDIEPDILGTVYPPHLGIIADAKAALSQLTEQAAALPGWQNWTAERKKVYQHSVALSSVNEKLAPNGIGYKDVMAFFNTHWPKNGIITNDAGNFASWLHHFHVFQGPKSYVGPTSGAMGYGFPAAVGAKIAHPDRPVISFSGDGGFMMTMQEIETAVRCQIPVTSLVFNNRMYGTIRMHQEIQYPDRVVGTMLGDIHIAQIAEAMGAKGRRVRTTEEFEKAWTEAKTETKTPFLIEIMVSPQQVSPTMILGDKESDKL